MRALYVAALALLAGACASDRLNLNPPAGVDFSGKWKLDEADSDDPQHVLQSPTSARQGQNPDAPQGRRSRSRNGAPPQGGLSNGLLPPSAGAMGGPLRFPGKQVEIKQVGGVVAFSSDGRNRVCEPGTAHKAQPKLDYRDREPDSGGRGEGVPPVCGWEEAVLIVKGGDPADDKPSYEEHYSLSDDRQRLVETVTFTRGRSSGFTLSRVWEKIPPQ
jgi:hypothetical protein